MSVIVKLGLPLLVVVQACFAHSDDIHIGRYESIPWGFKTNSWWVEGPDGVVIIDTQFLPSETKEMVRVAEAYTGKKVVLAFVLHANPDKFNGTQHLNQNGIRVVSSAQVVARIPEVDGKRRRWFYERYKPDYPAELILPESIGDRRTMVKAAGLEFKIHILGPSVSRDHIAVQVGGHLFVGDILANKHHAWLELGLIDEWNDTLDYLASLEPEHVYPGRGYASGKILISTQRKYLATFRDIVRKHVSGTPFNNALEDEIIAELEMRYPNYGNEFFLTLGVKPVWKALTIPSR